MWKVDGIVAHKHKQRSKAVVLSDSPAGVEWGNANLLGSIEGGLLIWRNRSGHVTYEWERVDPDMLDSLPPQLKNAQEPKGYDAAGQGRNKNVAKQPSKASKGTPQVSTPVSPAPNPALLAPPKNYLTATSNSPRSTASTASTEEEKWRHAPGTKASKEQRAPAPWAPGSAKEEMWLRPAALPAGAPRTMPRGYPEGDRAAFPAGGRTAPPGAAAPAEASSMPAARLAAALKEARVPGGAPNMMVNNKQSTQQTSNEVAKLLEMAGSRLASGDYGTAMQYVLFAQTLHPASKTQ